MLIFSEPTWDAGIRKIVIFRLDSLMIGVAAGWLNSEYRVAEKIGYLTCAAAAAVLLGGVIAVFLKGDVFLNTDFFSRTGLFPLASMGFAFIMLAGLRLVELPSRLTKPISACARWSYALYLAHMPVFYAIVAYLGFPKAQDPSGALSRWLLFIAFSFVVAASVEKWFERPIMRWRDRIFPD